MTPVTRIVSTCFLVEGVVDEETYRELARRLGVSSTEDMAEATTPRQCVMRDHSMSESPGQ